MQRSPVRPLGVHVDKAQASFSGMSLSALISYAYAVKLAQISGPGWLATERFDIVAKLPEGEDTGRVPEMMQALLADRFGLQLRRESREFPVYALVAFKSGMKLPPKPDGWEPKDHNDQLALPTLTLTLMLEQVVDLPVLDQTGLTGQYLFPARLIQQAMMAGATAQRVAPPSAGAPDAAEPANTDVAALLLPLGMRLEKKRVRMPVLVVEKIRQTPAGN